MLIVLMLVLWLAINVAVVGVLTHHSLVRESRGRGLRRPGRVLTH